MIVMLDGRDVDAVIATAVELLESSGAHPVVGLRDGRPVIVSDGAATEAMVDRVGSLAGVAAVRDLPVPTSSPADSFRPVTRSWRSGTR